ncbi:hypothetical protein FRC17_002956, partial [Serendipita sp. 399]
KPPISTIPNEILGVIFQEIVAQDPHTNHLRFAAVCRLWRDVILSTPTLWSRLIISDLKRGNNSTVYDLGDQNGTVWISGGYQACLSNDELNAALKRSGATPLTVNIEIWRSGLASTGVELMWGRLHRQPISNRIRHMQISLLGPSNLEFPPNTVYPVLTGLEMTFGRKTSKSLAVEDADPYEEFGPDHFPEESWSLPALSKLKLCTRSDLELPTWFSSTSMPNLQELEMRLNEDSPAEFSSTTFSNLKSLTIYADRPDQFLIRALESGPNLEAIIILKIQDGAAFLRRLSVPGADMLCPRLSIVVLECRGSKRTLEPLVRQVLAQRSGHLERFEVIWSSKDRKAVASYA